MAEKKSGRKAMGISLTEEIHRRVQNFNSENWSAVCRQAIEQKLQILEAERDQDRYKELRAMAAKDRGDLRETGYADGLNYPLQDLDYCKLRELASEVEPLIECNDPENIIDVLERKQFRISYDDWNYKLGMVDGLLRLKEIAEMPERQYEVEILGKPEKPTKLFSET